MIRTFFRRLWFRWVRSYQPTDTEQIRAIRMPAQGKTIGQPTGPLTQAVRELNRLEKLLRYIETETDLREPVPPEMIAWFKGIVDAARGEVTRLTRLRQQKSQQQ